MHSPISIQPPFFCRFPLSCSSLLSLTVALIFSGSCPSALLGQVTVEQALTLTPVQSGDVEYSIPSKEEAKNCTVSSPKEKGLSGWIVKDPAGRILRKFLDTNGDQDIDLWCYYRDGFEVYRDIDSNFDRNADQYRWFGSQGTRWGVDDNQDGKVDSWKRISAEEVSAEVAKALATRDEKRFQLLLMTDKELADSGFSEDKSKVIQKNIDGSKSTFRDLLGSGKLSKVEWLHFGGLRPGIIPKGTEGSTDDIVIYENVAALVRSQSKDLQISLGTMVQIENCWRLIDAPEIIDEKSSTSFASWYRSSDTAETNPTGTDADLNVEYQKLLEEFQGLDKKLVSASSSKQKQSIYKDLSEVISKLAIESDKEEDSMNWTRQFADTMTAALQSGDYPDGLESLQTFMSDLKKASKSDQAIALVKYRYINADFGAKLNDPKTDVAVAQTKWLNQLEDFTEKFPTDSNVPDAIMQLAMADEFDGEKDKAKKWYTKITTRFADSPFSDKAKGAIKRLESIGEKMSLSGKTLGGKSFDIADLNGKVVLVHYWADWCEICKDEFKQLEKLRARHPNLRLVGVNCDNDLATAKASANKTGVSWPQLHSEGGYNSGYAAEMGIVSLPTMVLIDKNGDIVSTTVSAGSLERELNSLLK